MKKIQSTIKTLIIKSAKLSPLSDEMAKLIDETLKKELSNNMRFACMQAITNPNNGLKAEAMAMEIFEVVEYYPNASGKIAPDLLLKDGKTIQVKYHGGEVNAKENELIKAINEDYSDYWLLVSANFKGLALITKMQLLEKASEMFTFKGGKYRINVSESLLMKNFGAEYKRIEAV